MFNLNTVPDYKITPGEYGSVEIKFNNRVYSLLNDGCPWMSIDTYTNIDVKQLYSSYDMAYGNVLITGLGFGMLTLWVANKPEVKTVTVYEISKDVIEAFLKSNKLPENVDIVNIDINVVSTDIKYDCILLDHYELEDYQYRIDNMLSIEKNIPNHDLIWAWSLEEFYPVISYGISYELLYGDFLYYNPIDFSDRWKDFVSKTLPLKHLPVLSKHKLNEYIYTYFDRLGYSIPDIIMS